MNNVLTKTEDALHAEQRLNDWAAKKYSEGMSKTDIRIWQGREIAKIEKKLPGFSSWYINALDMP